MSTLHVRVRVADEDYALPVGDVLEVAELGEVTPVPRAPTAVLGVRNLRGTVLPVLDMATVMGLSHSDRPACIVVAEQGGRSAGLAVDSVVGVEQLPEGFEEVEHPHLLGATLTDGALVGIVNIESVLDAVADATAT